MGEVKPTTRQCVPPQPVACGRLEKTSTSTVRKHASAQSQPSFKPSSTIPGNQCEPSQLVRSCPSARNAPSASLIEPPSHELESHVQRDMRVAAHTLRTANKTDEQLKQLRKDLDQVREENRKQKEQLASLEARVK